MVYLFGKKIVRTMEAIDTFLVFVILTVLITLTIIFAPGKDVGRNARQHRHALRASQRH